MGDRGRSEGAWIGNGGFVRSRAWAAAVATVCALCAVASLAQAAPGDRPWSAGGYVLLFGAVSTMFLPSALLGSRRSAGIRLVSVCVLAIGVAFALFTVATRMEPDWLDPTRSRDQVIRGASPGLALLGLVVGAFLLRASFRTIEPTDHLGGTRNVTDRHTRGKAAVEIG